jgi:hypothetical protein
MREVFNFIKGWYHQADGMWVLRKKESLTPLFLIRFAEDVYYFMAFAIFTTSLVQTTSTIAAPSTVQTRPFIW